MPRDYGRGDLEEIAKSWQLVFQFRAGIMLLYIIWAMKSTAGSRSQHVQQTIEEAISTCAINLAGFVHHWTDAMPYMHVLEFLRQNILQTGCTSLLGLSASISIEEVNLCLEQLKNNFLHQAVLRMIEDMVYGRECSNSYYDDLIERS